MGWGPIGDAGYLTRNQEVSEALARRLGTAHLRAEEALDALPAMLAAGVPVLHHAELVGAGRKQLPLLASPLFEDVAMPDEPGEASQAVDLRALVAGRLPDEARHAVAEALASELAAILQLPAAQVNLHLPLAQFGMDSLMAVELRTAVEARFGVSLPLFSLSEGLTLSALAARLVDPILDRAGANGQASAAPAAEGRDSASFGQSSLPDALALALARHERISASVHAAPENEAGGDVLPSPASSRASGHAAASSVSA